MARLPRLALPGHPHHLLQVGNNGTPIFLDAADRARLLELLADSAARHRVAVHAYALIEDRFHVLATPGADHGLQRFMQAIGRSYVRYFNDRHGRSGALWGGRYRSALIQAAHHLLACMVYIDLAPVRAGVVAEARACPWSSHMHYIGQRAERWLTPHVLYWSLGNTPFEREAAYATMVQQGLAASELAVLNDATVHGWAVGEPEFLHALQRSTQRRVAKGKPGRPRRTDGVDS
ncbi:MAG: transposase [Xenophilus sp.]